MEVWELKLYFYPSAGGFKKKKKKTKKHYVPGRDGRGQQMEDKDKKQRSSDRSTPASPSTVHPPGRAGVFLICIIYGSSYCRVGAV